MYRVFSASKTAVCWCALLWVLAAVSMFYLEVFTNEVAPDRSMIKQTWQLPGTVNERGLDPIDSSQWVFNYFQFEKSLWRIQSDSGIEFDTITRQQLDSLMDSIPQSMDFENWARFKELLSQNIPENKINTFYDLIKKYHLYRKILSEINTQYRKNPIQGSMLNAIYERKEEILDLQKDLFDRKTINTLFYESNQSMQFMYERQRIMATTNLTDTERSEALVELKLKYPLLSHD